MIKQNRGAPIILIVDDVEETRDGIESLLKADGYHVSPARHEEEAVARARCEGPDLILVSLGGAPNDVIATAQRIRERAELSGDVPVVIFCSPVIAEGAEVGIGSNVYVTRPDNFDQLRAFLGRLLRTLTPTS